LVDPIGHACARLGSEPELLLGTIDTELPGTIRARVPIL
jgi:hypothetical protein